MRSKAPRVTLVTTQAWPQVTRLAMRFAAYGCRVTAVCPPSSQLHRLGQVEACYSLSGRDPLRSIERAIEQSGTDFLVPADDLAVWLLHALTHRPPGYTSLVERSIGHPSGYAKVRSRHGLLSLARELGVDTPHTERVTGVEDVVRTVRSWPSGRAETFVIKKDGTFGGGGVGVVHGLAELPQQYARLTTLPRMRDRLKQRVIKADPTVFLSVPGLDEPEISVQTYIEGAAANAMFACDRGRILGGVQARVVASKEKTGPALMIQLMDDPRIARAGRVLAQALQLSGFFGLDYILEAGTGTPFLIEMNPRCTQLGHVALAGEPDLAGRLWAQWTGQQPPVDGDAALSDSIAFYPQALEWAPNSSFLRHARFDLSREAMAMVDALPTGNQAPHARLYRAVRRPLRAAIAVAPAASGQVFYSQDYGQEIAVAGAPRGAVFHETAVSARASHAATVQA